MKLSELTGWQRLGVAVAVLWVMIAILAALSDLVLPDLHRWLNYPNAPFIYLDDPPGLFTPLVWGRFIVLIVIPIALLWLLGWACAWIKAGFAKVFDARYLKAERLADTLALIQVLALDEHAHRSEDGLQTELQGKPRSSEAWNSLAHEHPEFFRVHPEGTHAISLIARHVAQKNEQGMRVLPSDYTAKLLQLAVELHDRQLRRAQAWHVFVPILVAVIAGSISLVGIALKG